MLGVSSETQSQYRFSGSLPAKSDIPIVFSSRLRASKYTERKRDVYLAGTSTVVRIDLVGICMRTRRRRFVRRHRSITTPFTLALAFASRLTFPSSLKTSTYQEFYKQLEIFFQLNSALFLFPCPFNFHNSPYEIMMLLGKKNSIDDRRYA